MNSCCCLVFYHKAGSLCLVYSRRESYLLNTNKARAHLHGGAPDCFQTENSYIVGIEHGISRTEVRVLTTELRRLYELINLKTFDQDSNLYKFKVTIVTLYDDQIM